MCWTYLKIHRYALCFLNLGTDMKQIVEIFPHKIQGTIYPTSIILLLLMLCWWNFDGHYWRCMMTSSNGNIFLITGPLWEESTGHQWSPLTRASDVELWYFLSSARAQIDEQTIENLAGDLRHHHAHHDITKMSIDLVSLIRIIYQSVT